MESAGNSLWRWITLIVSAAGIAGVAIVWDLIDEAGPGYLILCSLPFLIGATAALVRMETQSRILLLWATAGLSGLVAALTIFSGAGFVLLAGMVLYLAAAWGMNERERRSTSG